jgi:uncharacterized protein (TIGR02246 family)
MKALRLVQAAAAAALAGAALAGGGAWAQDGALGTWEDRVLIELTLQRYIRGYDANDPEMFASAFAEDGVFEFNDDVYTGRAEIAAYIADRNAARAAREAAGQSDSSARLYHVMTNSIITFDGPDKAHHSAYGMTIGRTTGETHISSSGSYEDELVKREGEWLIQRRRLDQLPLFVPPPPPEAQQ